MIENMNMGAMEIGGAPGGGIADAILIGKTPYNICKYNADTFIP